MNKISRHKKCNNSHQKENGIFFGKQINAKKREVSHFPSTKAMQTNFHEKISNFTGNPGNPGNPGNKG